MIRNYNVLGGCRDTILKNEKGIGINLPPQKSEVGKKSWLFGLFVFFCMIFTGFTASAQVTVTATAGTAGPTPYATVKLAFDAINAGTHQGAVTININASTTEGTTPATLNSNGAGAALYTSVLLRPTVDGVSISGTPATGFGIIQLKGADNVTIDGDNPNSGGINQNLTITNTALATVNYVSCIRIATAATVTSADSITIKNCIVNGNVTSGNISTSTSTVGPSNTTFGIYAGGNGGASAIDAPTAIASVTTNSAASGTTINNLVIDNNAVNQCARAIVFNGAATTVSAGTLSITNNNIGDQATSNVGGTPPFTSPSTTVYTKGIFIAGATTVSVLSNKISNILSYVGTATNAIELNSAIGSSVTISSNTITTVVPNGTSTARGIVVTSAAGPTATVTGNTISNINSISSNAAGIEVNYLGTTTGIVSNNKVTTVRSRSTGGFGATGIRIATGSGWTVTNNFVSDVLNIGSASFSGSFNAVGIKLAGGLNHKVYHNTVSLFGVSTSTGSNSITCLEISASTLTGIDVRNNIFSNTVTGGAATDAHVCVFLPFVASATMLLNLNNNAYYTGSVAASGLGFGGATAFAGANLFTVPNFVAGANSPATNWRSFSSALGVAATDNASIASTTAAPFLSTTDLHINLGVTPSQLESGGATVGLLSDIDGQVRPGPAGSVNGGATAPDLGADEFDGVPLDIIPPAITYTPLSLTCATGARTLTTTITDASGVPTSGAGLPRLYWRINAGAYTPVIANFVSGSTYTFTFGAGVVVADVVSYYIVAQDNLANVGGSPGGGSGFTANPPTAATPPGTPSSYTIGNTLSGTYTVGAAGNYATLTAAAAAYNTNCLSGAVVFSLIDASYPTETYPITFNANADASAVNTLTIRPAAGIASAFSGTTAGTTTLIRLNGADYVTINGLNTGGSSLTFTNTNTAGGGVIWIASASASNGATNNTVTNCTILGTSTGSAATIAGIIAGSGTTLGGVAEAANSNNTITNNVFKGTQNGIFASGIATFDLNWVISNNAFGSTVATEKHTFRGLIVQNAQNFTISNNTIAGVVSASTSTASGIQLGGTINGGTISGNRISDIKNTNTGGWGSNGISLGGSVASGVNVFNNFVRDVASYGFNGVGSADNGYGILVSAGGGFNIYYNTVSLDTDQTTAGGITAAVNVLAAVTTVGAINMRDNIFSNTQTTGTRYAVYNASTAGATVFSAINYNDYSAPIVGFQTAAQATLANWQAATTQDANSIAIAPVFVSATDLHLDIANNGLLNNLGTPIAGITTDIDNATRSVTTPDMGADEFNSSACAGANGGDVSADITSCGPVTSPAISASNYSAGIGSTYQWVSSTSAGNYPLSGTPVSGQNNPTALTTGLISATTYYWLRVTCSTNTSTDYSSSYVTVTVNPIPPMPSVLCYQTATLNTSTCTWSVTGTAPSAPSGGEYALISEGFDNFTTLAGAGWSIVNTSVPAGTVTWQQGGAIWTAQSGAATSWAQNNFNTVTGANTISNWFIAPQRILQNGDVIKFWTRTVTAPAFPDRMQVRLSTTGAGTNPSSPTDLGSYTTLLADINPTYTLSGYPNVWTQYTLTVSGLSGPTSSRVAFRYFTEDGGPSGANSDNIGLDTFSITRPIAELGCPAQSYVLNTSDCTYSITGSCSSIVDLKLYIEGYYDVVNHQMVAAKFNQSVPAATNEVTTLTVQLLNQNTLAVEHTTTTELKQDGTAVCTFTTAPVGSFFLKVTTWNTIQTYSKLPVPVGSTPYSYNFSDVATKAAGDNQKLLEPGVYGIYSGNFIIGGLQDPNIDNSDYSIWEADYNDGLFNYIATDLNGDANPDNADYSIWEGNYNDGIYEILPDPIP